jgi:hypothetical protein
LLFKAKFGEDFDSDDEDEEDEEEDPNTRVDADGTTWHATRGRTPTLSSLDKKLSDLKLRYNAKFFGDDVDEEDEVPYNTRIDADGTVWNVFRGEVPTEASLEDKLAQVKQLYKDKFGEDVDDESEPDTRVDEDGTTWEVYRGAAPALSSLEKKLAEVKELYFEKTGEDLDADHETQVDADGTTWHVWRGEPPTTEDLTSKLRYVKFLYKAKYGEGFDSDEEEEDDYETKKDDDGTTWHVYRGRVPSLNSLEQKLKKVKELYKQKTGDDFDSDDSDEDSVLQDTVIAERPSPGRVMETSHAEQRGCPLVMDGNCVVS